MHLPRFARLLARSALHLFAVACSAALLASCGGGGGGGGGGGSGLPASSSLAEQCAAPRPAGTIDPFTNAPYGDVMGSLVTEKAFQRSWIDETYLWYQDVRALPAATLNATAYATPQDYFNALKTPLITATMHPKDKFHFFIDTPTWVAEALSGQAFGYGFQVALLNATAPNRVAIVAFTEPATQATAAGIARGASIITVDGVDLGNGTDLATLNAGLFPTQAGTHTFTILEQGAASTHTVTLNATQITETPVQNVKTLPAPNSTVGYMLFNDHIATAESELIDAINTLKTAGVTDLVLDIRYNGGGFLDIAAELAYMIGGTSIQNGAFFEREMYNDRNPFNLTTAQTTTDFHATSQGFTVSSGQALPTLNLSRVYVLTTADTCSASEAIVNGLRGAGVTVNLIGGTTCGKPYGFFPRDNCSTTYFAIQFQGVNNAGFGDYPDGFAPTCAVADDFTKALGDPGENQLEVALGLRNTGTCITPLSLRERGLSAQRATASTGPVLVRSPFRENRIFRPK